jgi:glycosyltransferase involved in cell wall biosynthesis
VSGVGSRLLLISGVLVSRTREDLSPEEPIPDYIVVAEELCPDILDPVTVRRIKHPLVRAASWLGGPDWGVAVAALLVHRDYSAVMATGEDVGLRLALLARLTRARLRLLMTCHNLTGRRSRIFLGPFGAARKVAVFHCMTPDQARALAEDYGVPPGRIRVVHWHVDHRFFRPGRVLGEGARRVCSAGMASRDYATLLEAARGLNLELKIAADSPWFPEPLNVSPEEAGPEAEIKSAGTYAALREIYASSLFVVVPLRDVDHAAGLSVILEGMAMGKAVIATRTRSPDGLVVDGRNGFHVRAADPDALRERMRFLLDHPEEAERMGAEGRRMVEESFTIDAYLELLKESLEPAEGEVRAA